MLKFILGRAVIAVPLLFAISLVAFFLIQLPEGDYLSMYIARLRATGTPAATGRTGGW